MIAPAMDLALQHAERTRPSREHEPCQVCGNPLDYTTDRLGRLVPACVTCEQNAFRRTVGAPEQRRPPERQIPEPTGRALGGLALRGRRKVRFAERAALLLAAIDAAPGGVATTAILAAATNRRKQNLADDLVRLVADGSLLRVVVEGRGRGGHQFAYQRAAETVQPTRASRRGCNVAALKALLVPARCVDMECARAFLTRSDKPSSHCPVCRQRMKNRAQYRKRRAA